MTAVVTLEAAIDKLERQKAGADPIADAQIGVLTAAIEATQAHPLGYTHQAVSAAFTLANAIIGRAS